MALISSPFFLADLTNKGPNMGCGGTSSKASCQPDQHAEFSIWGSGEEVCRDALFSAIRSSPSSLRMLAVDDIGLRVCNQFTVYCIGLTVSVYMPMIGILMRLQFFLRGCSLFHELSLPWLVPHLWHQYLNPTTRTSFI